MASVNAPLLDSSGKKSKDFELEEAVFGAEVKPHLVHEAVRAELNSDRAGTRGAKSRGLVSGGRSKPWRQKGTGRARAGTIRAPQFTGGGVAFPPTMRSFDLKMNKKARHAALRSALSDHAAQGTVAIVGKEAFSEPSTKTAVGLLDAWAQEPPLLVIAHPEEEALIKSFRNLKRTLVTVPGELEVAQVVWARSVLVSEGAIEVLQRRAA
jgi:large subunit ribosomal protein L4